MPRKIAPNAEYVRLWSVVEAEMKIQNVPPQRLAHQLGISLPTFYRRFKNNPEKMTLQELSVIWKFMKIPRERLIDYILREK